MKASQLPLAFLAGMDQSARLAKKRMQLRNSVAILKAHVEQYPPTAEEWDIMLGGIRLARHVGEWECRKCSLGSTDHSLGWVFPTLVCLKDAYRRGCRQEWNEY